MRGAPPAVPTIDKLEESSKSEESNDIIDNLAQTLNVWKNFKNSPSSLWIILACKFIESFSFITEDLTFMLFYHDEFGMDDVECGLLYSMCALLIFFYGLLISGFIIDTAGVKVSLLLGSALLTTARFTITFTKSKTLLYIAMTTIAPLGFSLCKINMLTKHVIVMPTMTLGIKKCTLGKTRSLAYSTYYGMLTIGLLLSGPTVDFIRGVIGGKYH
jgi:hypothetical protein